MRKPKAVMAAALRMYFDGSSLPKTGRSVREFFGVTAHASTVFRWIEKYVPMADALLANFAPDLSGVWHVDETTLRFRPSRHRTDWERANRVRRPGEDWWHWDAIDMATRFVVGTHISRTRSWNDGLAFLRACAVLAPRPEKVVTDDLNVYPRLVKRVFYSNDPSRRVGHVHSQGGFRGNQLIERWHGTLEDRITAMRGLKTPRSQIPRGIVIDYNFLRPYLSLGGRTPAKAAHIDLPFNDGWGNLMTWATVYQTLCRMRTKQSLTMG
jgi:transposase-like protein